jgi:hypothetical protein
MLKGSNPSKVPNPPRWVRLTLFSIRDILVLLIDRSPIVGPRLSLCGGTLPAGMLGADSVNPCGSWEPRKAVRLNEAILQRHRSALYEPTLRLQEEDVFDAKERAACIGKIGAFLTRLPAAPHVVIKEWRITIDLSTREEGSIEDYDLAVLLSLHHLPPALAARVFAEGTRAANKLLIIGLHVWRRSWGAMACTLARFNARRTTRHRTSAWAGSWCHVSNFH